MPDNDNNAKIIWSDLNKLITSPYTLFALIGIAVLLLFGGIYYGGGALLQSLQDSETARGLITFLVAITTVSIALILALYAVVSNGEDLKERFALGKEILTTLIGVLGTIIGFYFGSSDIASKTAVPEISGATSSLQLAPVFISNNKPKKGDSVTISSFISGGGAPYTYSIIFEPPGALPSIAGKTSPDGSIRETFKWVQAFEKQREIYLKIEVGDSSGKTVIFADKSNKFTLLE